MEPRDKPPWSPGRWFGGQREIPLITRDYQDRVLVELQENVGITDVCWRKSREMGASWLVVCLSDWYWRFRPYSAIGMCSKDEDTLDSPKNYGSLMAKLDFVDQHLPAFLRAGRERDQNKHVIRNTDNGSAISGFAATTNVGRGDRFLFFVQDEAHFFPVGRDYAVHDSLQGTTHSRIMISTVNRERGMSGAFYDFATSDMLTSVHRIELGWWEDADKCKGLYTTENGRLTILDKLYKYPDGYEFVLDGRKRSPYYDWECRRVASHHTIAAELDMDFGGSSNRLFDQQLIADCLKNAREPIVRGRFQRINDDEGSGYVYLPEFIIDDLGEIELWFEPKIDAKGRVISPEGQNFSLGIDIAAGTGTEISSCSAIIGFHHETGEQILQYRSNTIRPDELANLAIAAGLWLNRAIICPETNGAPGSFFMQQFQKHGYPNPYLRQRNVDEIRRGFVAKVGLHNRDGGETILGELQNAMLHRKVRINSKVIIQELSRYVRVDGKVRHPLIGKESGNLVPERSHGDCAIGCACAWYAIHDRPVGELRKKEMECPPGSWLASRREYEARKAKEGIKSWWSPDYGKGKTGW